MKKDQRFYAMRKACPAYKMPEQGSERISRLPAMTRLEKLSGWDWARAASTGVLRVEETTSTGTSISKYGIAEDNVLPMLVVLIQNEQDMVGASQQKGSKENIPGFDVS